MSCQENDKIYEAAFEDFCELYFTSDSFALKVEGLIMKYCDEDTIIKRSLEDVNAVIKSGASNIVEAIIKKQTILGIVFDALWKNDCELLIHNKRIAVEALLEFNKSMKVFKS